jgi:type II secretory pathway pseudopilin PulG
MAILVLAAAVALPPIAREIKRSREDELIHRAMEYRRAIKRYVKQTGRYPLSLDDLNSGGVRCLRKRYKDPITGRDFKPLHMLEVARLQNATPNQPADESQNVASDSQPDPSSSSTADGPPAANSPTPANSFATGAPNSLNSSGGSPALSSGGLIIGVASTSKEGSIREFDHKNHYDQWLFYYDPSYDRGPDRYGPTVMSSGVPPNGLGNPPGNANQAGAPGTMPTNINQTNSQQSSQQ